MRHYTRRLRYHVSIPDRSRDGESNGAIQSSIAVGPDLVEVESKGDLTGFGGSSRLRTMAFKCTVVTPEQQALDESVAQVIIPAWDGQVGILTDRAPLLVKLGLGELRIDLPGGQTRKFFVDGGIAQMKDNRLTILTNEATAAEDIDAEAARAEYAAAEASSPSDTKSREERTHKMDRARSRQELAKSK